MKSVLPSRPKLCETSEIEAPFCVTVAVMLVAPLALSDWLMSESAPPVCVTVASTLPLNSASANVSLGLSTVWLIEEVDES